MLLSSGATYCWAWACFQFPPPPLPPPPLLSHPPPLPLYLLRINNGMYGLKMPLIFVMFLKIYIFINISNALSIYMDIHEYSDR